MCFLPRHRTPQHSLPTPFGRAGLNRHSFHSHLCCSYLACRIQDWWDYGLNKFQQLEKSPQIIRFQIYLHDWQEQILFLPWILQLLGLKHTQASHGQHQRSWPLPFDLPELLPKQPFGDNFMEHEATKRSLLSICAFNHRDMMMQTCPICLKFTTSTQRMLKNSSFFTCTCHIHFSKQHPRATPSKHSSTLSPPASISLIFAPALSVALTVALPVALVLKNWT